MNIHMYWGVGVWKEPASCLLGIIGAFLSLTAEAAWVLGEERGSQSQPKVSVSPVSSTESRGSVRC